ncbi:MAG: DJ-1/PfpI family protein [Anaerolineae bacterium]|jgi:4-methyl-5(b-hydroxyethyl)-thiazole monophosphate biosynthesis|nr:DJ-1/PfpI family protein [Anaerolineae bacterium]
MKRVLLLLANGVELFEAAAFTDVLGWADTFGAERIDLVCAGLHPRLRCTFGPDLIPDVQLDQVRVEDFDALAIPGGFEMAGFYGDGYAEPFLDIIRQFDRAGKPIAAICVGALPLARSGVLARRRATTYKLLGGKRRQQLAEMGAEVVDAALVRDGNVITSTGPSMAADVALTLVEALTSPENTAQVRELMGFEQ